MSEAEKRRRRRKRQKMLNERKRRRDKERRKKERAEQRRHEELQRRREDKRWQEQQRREKERKERKEQADKRREFDRALKEVEKKKREKEREKKRKEADAERRKKELDAEKERKKEQKRLEAERRADQAARKSGLAGLGMIDMVTLEAARDDAAGAARRAVAAMRGLLDLELAEPHTYYGQPVTGQAADGTEQTVTPEAYGWAYSEHWQGWNHRWRGEVANVRDAILSAGQMRRAFDPFGTKKQGFDRSRWKAGRWKVEEFKAQLGDTDFALTAPLAALLEPQTVDVDSGIIYPHLPEHLPIGYESIPTHLVGAGTPWPIVYTNSQIRGLEWYRAEWITNMGWGCTITDKNVESGGGQNSTAGGYDSQTVLTADATDPRQQIHVREGKPAVAMGVTFGGGAEMTGAVSAVSWNIDLSLDVKVWREQPANQAPIEHYWKSYLITGDITVWVESPSGEHNRSFTWQVTSLSEDESEEPIGGFVIDTGTVPIYCAQKVIEDDQWRAELTSVGGGASVGQDMAPPGAGTVIVPVETLQKIEVGGEWVWDTWRAQALRETEATESFAVGKIAALEKTFRAFRRGKQAKFRGE